MGLNKRSDKTYLRVIDGKFFRSTDKEKTDPHTSVDGRLVNIYIKNETYNNEDIEKLVLDLDGGDGLYSVSLNLDSSYASTLLSFLANADLSQPLELFPSVKKEGDKEKRTIFVRQFDQALKSAFTKDNPNGLPQMKKVKVSGKIKWDKTDFLEFFRELIGEFKEKLGKAPATKKEPEGIVQTEDIEETEGKDGLPF